MAGPLSSQADPAVSVTQSFAGSSTTALTPLPFPRPADLHDRDLIHPDVPGMFFLIPLLLIFVKVQTSVASAILASVPIVIAFALVQKRFVQGLSTGAVKG
jgi:hypothetical protein